MTRTQTKKETIRFNKPNNAYWKPAKGTPDGLLSLKKLFVENTGAHMLDSGGAYGRIWERNQISPPWKNPIFDWTADGASRNTYAFLAELLIENKTTGGLNATLARVMTEEGEGWTAIGAFEDDIMPNLGMESFLSENTHNGECCLDQTLQFVLFGPKSEQGIHESGFVALQVHGGCDVRGGYTTPRIYALEELSAMLNYNNYHVETRKRLYRTDDDCHYYAEEPDDNTTKNWEELHAEGIKNVFA